jgi:hypothetical protein
MIIKSFKYYLSIYKNIPELDRGLGFWYLPFIMFFLLMGFFVLPIYPIRSFILFGYKMRLKNEIIEFVFSKNQLKISNELNIVDSTLLNFINSDISKHKNSIIISNYKLFFIAILNSWEVFYFLIKSLAIKKVSQNSVRIIRMVSISKIAKYHLKGAKAFVQYNDHAPYNVMSESIARRLGLKTVYIQHAPVSYKFPPLYHDLNVLFSEDSKVKYRHTTGEEFDSKNVITMCDFRLPMKEFLPIKTPDYVLICYNELDSLTEIEKCASLFIDSGYNVKLRPHPADDRPVKFNDKIKVSGKEASIWDDLSSSICVIVNETAVPLESLYYDIPTYKLSLFSKSVKDNYNFISKGLFLKEYNSLEMLLYDIKHGIKSWDETKIFYFLGNINNKKNEIIQFNNELHKLIN